jgi:hypothetical protein
MIQAPKSSGRVHIMNIAAIIADAKAKVPTPENWLKRQLFRGTGPENAPGEKDGFCVRGALEATIIEHRTGQPYAAHWKTGDYNGFFLHDKGMGDELEKAETLIAVAAITRFGQGWRYTGGSATPSEAVHFNNDDNTTLEMLHQAMDDAIEMAKQELTPA